MARGQSVYQGAYTFPVQSTAAQSIQQGAQAQAQMYSSLGQAFGKAANTYFEKKDEDAQIESLAQDERILNMLYGDRKDARGMSVMPTDFKEVKKDVKALFKGLGGREGVENYLMRDRAEQRAQETARQRDVVWKQLQTERKDSDRYVDALLKSPDVTTTEIKEVGRIKGGMLRDIIPGLEPPPPVDLPPFPSQTSPSQLTQPVFNPVTGEVTQPTAQPESTYASLMGKVRSGMKRLGEVEIPEIPFAEPEVTTRPGQSLLARSPGMTGPAFAEAFMLQNPDATPGMKRQLARVASAMPQKVPEAPVEHKTESFTMLVDPDDPSKVQPGSVQTLGGAKPTFSDLQGLQAKSDNLQKVLRDLDKVDEILGMTKNEQGRYTPKAFTTVEADLLGPGWKKRGKRWLVEQGATWGQSEELINQRSILKMFISKNVVKASGDLQGAISEGELKLLQENAPELDTNPAVWRDYIMDLRDTINMQLGINRGIGDAANKPPIKHRTAQQIFDFTIQTTGGVAENVKEAINILETSDDPSMSEDSRLEAVRMLREKFNL